MSAKFDDIKPAPEEKYMTIACRIDDITVSATGVVSIAKTTGYPLPVELGAQGHEYPSKAALIQAVQEAEDVLASISHLLTISRFLKTDPLLANLAAIKGRGVIYDLTGPAAVSQNI